MTECDLAHSDAAYVLGSLSPTDRLEFERHLPGCERCRRSVTELAGLPGLLGRVPREQVEAPLPFEPLPQTVLPALVAAVRREQRRKTVLVTLGAAAAVAVVALGATALQAGRDDGPTPQVAPTNASSSLPAPLSMEVVGQDWGMRADVTLTSAQGGTKVDVLCSYAERESDYEGSHAYRYKLIVFSRGHDPEVASSWKAGAGDTVRVPGFTAAEIGEITRLEVQNDYGETLLRARH